MIPIKEIMIGIFFDCKYLEVDYICSFFVLVFLFLNVLGTE